MFRLFISALAIAATFIPRAHAEQDSLAVIHRPHTVLVQVNEKGANGRLQALFSCAGARTELSLENDAKTFRLRCARNEEAATCTARFNQGPGVEIFSRGAQASAEIGCAAEHPLSLAFASANGDKLKLEAQRGRLYLRAEKR